MYVVYLRSKNIHEQNHPKIVFGDRGVRVGQTQRRPAHAFGARDGPRVARVFGGAQQPPRELHAVSGDVRVRRAHDRVRESWVPAGISSQSEPRFGVQAADGVVSESGGDRAPRDFVQGRAGDRGHALDARPRDAGGARPKDSERFGGGDEGGRREPHRFGPNDADGGPVRDGAGRVQNERDDGVAVVDGWCVQRDRVVGADGGHGAEIHVDGHDGVGVDDVGEPRESVGAGSVSVRERAGDERVVPVREAPVALGVWGTGTAERHAQNQRREPLDRGVDREKPSRVDGAMVRSRGEDGGAGDARVGQVRVVVADRGFVHDDGDDLESASGVGRNHGGRSRDRDGDRVREPVRDVGGDMRVHPVRAHARAARDDDTFEDPFGGRAGQTVRLHATSRAQRRRGDYGDGGGVGVAAGAGHVPREHVRGGRRRGYDYYAHEEQHEAKHEYHHELVETETETEEHETEVDDEEKDDDPIQKDDGDDSSDQNDKTIVVTPVSLIFFSLPLLALSLSEPKTWCTHIGG